MADSTYVCKVHFVLIVMQVLLVNKSQSVSGTDFQLHTFLHSLYTSGYISQITHLIQFA